MNMESSVTVARDLTEGDGPWGPGPSSGELMSVGGTGKTVFG
jgi:hypothetical protein